MAYTEIFINSAGSTASDLYNSGSPRVQIVNSATSPTNYLKATIIVGNTVTIACLNNAQAVILAGLLTTAAATYPRMLIFVNDTTSNAAAAKRNFAWFGSADVSVSVANVIITLPGTQAFHTAASGLDWGVGGERATALSASSSRLFYNFGTGDIANLTGVAGQSTRTVICANHAEAFTNANEWRVKLPAYFLSGTGGTQHHIVSEAYSSTPVAGRPTFTYTGSITVAMFYENTTLDWDGGFLAGINFYRATGTNYGSTSAAIKTMSRVRIVDCKFTCAPSASITGGYWLLVDGGSEARDSAAFIGNTVIGHTGYGVFSIGGTSPRFIDNLIVGGTHGLFIQSGTRHATIVTGNRFANCSTVGLWYQGNGTTGRGTTPTALFSHNSVLNCGIGIKIEPMVSATINESIFNFANVYNNNVERCTTGITTAGALDPTAAILEGTGITIYGNNTGSGAAVCTNRYGTQAALIQQGGIAIDTRMSYTNGVFSTGDTTAATAGVGSTSLGASQSSLSMPSRPIPGPPRR